MLFLSWKEKTMDKPEEPSELKKLEKRVAKLEGEVTELMKQIKLLDLRIENLVDPNPIMD